MLSYLHSFHAGNHADVLKHAALSLLLNRLKEKDKPFVYIDTHAGAGIYDLKGDEARKNSEFKGGIGRLRQAHERFPELTDYLRVAQMHDNHYPGSPQVAADMLRDGDRLILMELHNREVRELRKNLGGDPRVAIHHRDGFEGLTALAPPKPARGLVLMDPSYEVAEDYEKALAALAGAAARWPTGIYMLWYPVLARQRDQSRLLRRRLQDCGFNSLLLAELRVREQQEEFGMCGSALAVVNAPWRFDQQLRNLLPKLQALLAEDSGAGWKLEWLIKGG
ncbi:MAG TPA: 23S rRNA (adenine(2030)-N(6))-methyltransferase RlmJ [Gammaproteobacteria bacterium]|nr:23S rRNA (adenine(2030)-N(6))-methyltransferase RlmJ [Gammaproteobacteria bacterium]